MKKLILFLSTVFVATQILCSQSFMDETFFSNQEVSYDELLKKYSQADSTLERSKIKMQQSQNNFSQTQIKNGLSLNLSSGDVKISESEVSFTPSATLKVPSLNNLAVSTNVSSKVSEGEFEYAGTKINASADIISGKKKEAEISKIENERSLFNAKNNLANEERGVEGSFLESIQAIYDKASSLMQLKETYLEKERALEQTVVNGYTKTSSKYKIAKIERDSAYSDCEKTYREYQNLLSEFCVKCDVQITYLITNIPDVELLNFSDFDMNCFSKIDQALYNQKMGELKRAANKNWTLSANLGFNQTNVLNQTQNSLTTGAQTSWGGLGFGMNVDIPFTQNKEPSLTLNMSVNPFGWKTKQLSEANEELEEKLLQLDIDDAYENYKSTKINYENQAQTLNWEQDLLLEQTTYYKEVCDEMKKAYNSGLINKTEYIKAENQYMKAYLNMLKNKIKKIKYNLDVQKLFVANS